MKKVLVIGSVNIDHVYQLSRMPAIGETMETLKSDIFFGGKGANQAVASSLFGADTSFLGAIGNDQYKDDVISNFKEKSVSIEKLNIVNGQKTGNAMVLSIDGDNSIVLERGANSCVNQQFIKDHERYIKSFDVLLIQNEIDDSAIKSICKIKSCHQILVYNPAPFRMINKEIIEKIDYITPNELEYQELMLSGVKIALDKLIITQGAKGVNYQGVNYPAKSVIPQDTTGAGDCFNGVLAACLSLDMNIQEAIKWAVLSATQSTLKVGAQTGYSTKAELSNK